MSTNNQPDRRSVTAGEMIDSYRSQVDSDFIRLVESAMNHCRDEFDSKASFMVPALKNSLTRLNEVCSFSSGVAYVKERNAKKFQDAVDNRNPDVVVKHQGSTEPKKVPPFWLDVPVDKKSHDEVNKDLGSTVWIDEQLEFTLPEQPTEEPKKLKLEHGKLYVARNGRIVKAIAKPPGSDEWYPFYARPVSIGENSNIFEYAAQEYSVTENGNYWSARISGATLNDHASDLIAEYVETKDVSKFEVGKLYLTREGEVVRIEEGVFFGHTDPSLIGNEPLIARCVYGEVKKGWFVQDGGKFLLTGEEHPRDIVSEITDPVPTPIGSDGSLDLTAEILATTHVIEYSPNCAQRFLIRIPGYGKPYIDKRSPGTTDDAIGYGNNPEDAFKQALAKREEQKVAKS